MRDAGGRFQAGASGNPRSRPRDRGLQHEIEHALAKRVDSKTRLQLVAEKVVEMALKCDMRAAEFIGKRMWPERPALEGGKPEVLLILRDYTARTRMVVEAGGYPVVDAHKLGP